MHVGDWRTSQMVKRYSIVASDDSADAIRKVQERERLVLLQLNDNRLDEAPVAPMPVLN